MRNLILIICILFFYTSCTKTRELNDYEVNFMPYKSGEELVFVNTSNEKVDTIFIKKIERYIPDGPMVYFNETIAAIDKNDRQIVRVSAGYGKYSESYLSIKGLDGRHSLKEISEKPVIEFETQNLSFDDVVIIEAKNKQSDTNKVIKVHWSKSKGIVQYVDVENGTWQILNQQSSERN
ncbi:hypothetical protein [Flagellimonas pacifica]|nr:hypothetical protein [Allomuricauda parva]